MVHNFLLTQEAETNLTHNARITITSPNVVVMNLVWGIAGLSSRPLARRLASTAAVAIIAACVLASHAQAKVWRDSVAYSTRTTEITLGLGEFDAHMVAGGMMDQNGRRAEAIAHYSEAIRLQPHSASARQHLGQSLAMAGRPADALPHLQEALRMDSGLTAAHRMIGAILVSQGHYEEALPPLLEAARREPNDESTQVDLGIALTFTHRTREAIQAFDAALRLNPGNAVAARAKAELTALAKSPAR